MTTARSIERAIARSTYRNIFERVGTGFSSSSSNLTPLAPTLSRSAGEITVTVSLSAAVPSATGYSIETQIYDTGTDEWVTQQATDTITLSGGPPLTGTLTHPPAQMRARLRATDGEEISSPSAWSASFIHADYIVNRSTGDDGDDGTTDISAWASLASVRSVLSSQGSEESFAVLARQGDYLSFSGDHLDAGIEESAGTLYIGFEPSSTLTGETELMPIGSAVDANACAIHLWGLGPVGAVGSTEGKFHISGFNRNISAGATDNGLATRNGGELRAYNIYVSDCADGASAHGGTDIYLYDVTIDTCSKGALQSDLNANNHYLYRSSFTAGAPGATSTEIGNLGNENITAVDCEFLSDGTYNNIAIDINNAVTQTYTRCKFGTPTNPLDLSVQNSTGPEDLVFTDCYFNASLGNNRWRTPLTLTRCYGKLSGALRGNVDLTNNIIVEYCVWVGGSSPFIFGNFFRDPDFYGIGYTITDNVFAGFTTGSDIIGEGFSAEQVTAFLNDSTVTNNNQYSNSGLFTDAGLSSVVSGTLNIDPVLAGGDLATVAASSDQADYAVTAAGLIGTGTGGANIGFTVADISTD